jgi:hypothetical protein
MLVIRDSQLRILAESSFEHWLVKHVQRFFPDFAQKFKNSELLAWVSENRPRATRYFRTESGISFYIDLACLLGEHFPEDPRLPWAREILSNPGIDEAQRRRMLYTKTRVHLLGPIPQGRIRRSA